MAEQASERAELAGVPVMTAEEAVSLDDTAGKEGVKPEAMVNRVGYVSGQLILKELIPRLVGKDANEVVVTVLAGTGNKGGGALSAARNLADAGVTVNVVLARKVKEYQGHTKTVLDGLEKKAKKVYTGYNERAFEQADLIIDGLIGCGLQGTPRASVSLLIKGANFSMKPSVAMDVPSGLNATTGMQSPVTLKASATLSVILPKRGMLGDSNQAICGEIWLVDAGVPPAVLTKHLGTEIPDPFKGADYVRLTGREEETA